MHLTEINLARCYMKQYHLGRDKLKAGMHLTEIKLVKCCLKQYHLGSIIFSKLRNSTWLKK